MNKSIKYLFILWLTFVPFLIKSQSTDSLSHIKLDFLEISTSANLIDENWNFLRFSTSLNLKINKQCSAGLLFEKAKGSYDYNGLGPDFRYTFPHLSFNPFIEAEILVVYNSHIDYNYNSPHESWGVKGVLFLGVSKSFASGKFSYHLKYGMGFQSYEERLGYWNGPQQIKDKFIVVKYLSAGIAYHFNSHH